MSKARKISALVVDDDRVIRRVEDKLLSKHGLVTETAENGKEAVDLFKAGNMYDIVIMDMEMPEMDGPEATLKLREMGVRSIIVGVTSNADENKKNEFVAAGLDYILDKPLKAQGVAFILELLAKK